MKSKFHQITRKMPNNDLSINELLYANDILLLNIYRENLWTYMNIIIDLRRTCEIKMN